MLQQYCAYSPIKFRHRKHLVRVRKRSSFWFKIPVSVTTDKAGDVLT